MSEIPKAEKYTARKASLAGPESLAWLRRHCPEFARANAEVTAAKEHARRVFAAVDQSVRDDYRRTLERTRERTLGNGATAAT